jgi:hypothetical protein
MDRIFCFPVGLQELKEKVDQAIRSPDSSPAIRCHGEEEKGENLPYNEFEQGVANILLLHVHSVFQLEVKYHWVINKVGTMSLATLRAGKRDQQVGHLPSAPTYKGR